MAAPLSGTSFVTGDNVTLTANATDSDGQVVKVEFFSNGSMLGSVTSAPYNFVWNNVQAGVFTVSAKATDNSGASTTSATVFFSVMTSPGSVNHAIELANSIVGGFEWSGTYPGAGGESPNSAAVAANLDALAFNIQNAYRDFNLGDWVKVPGPDGGLVTARCMSISGTEMLVLS